MKKVVLLALSVSSLYCSHFSTNLGIDFNYARYEIGKIAKQSGYLAGPHFDFAYKKLRSVYTGIDFDGRWNAGLICSKSNLCNTSCLTGGCVQADVADYFTDWKIGYYYLSSQERFSLTPYTGLGFQHLSYQIDPSLMRYKYYQIYVPIGLEFMYHSDRNFSIGCQAQYRAGAYSRLKVSTPCVEDCDSSCDDKIHLRYSHGFNFKVPSTLHYRTDKRVGFNLSCIPFFDWNKFSDTCDTNSEGVVFPIPTNKRWYLGINANIGITF